MSTEQPFSTTALDEIKQLNDYARATFSQFVGWWVFFIAKNLIAASYVTSDPQPPTYLLIAWVVFVLDILGAAFCLLVSCRLVQTNDRITELATQRDPSESPLGNPARIRAMFREVIVQWLGQPRRTLTEYNSPLPISFYLWCTLPCISNCLIVATCWVAGIAHFGWWKPLW